MAKNVISLVIDGDAKGALAALAQTDAGIKGFVAKLRANSKTTGVLLAAGVAAGAVAIGKQLYDLGSKFDAEFDKIRVATGASEVGMQRFQGVFKDVLRAVPEDFAKVGDAISQLGQRIGDASDHQLKSIAERFLELSRLTGTDLTTNIKNVEDAFKNWGVTVAQQPKLLDYLFRASQRSGVSVGDLGSQMADVGLQLRASGISFRDSTALLAAFGQAGVDVGDVLPALTKSMAVAAKQGKPTAVAFNEILYAIKNAPDAAAGAQVALADLGAKAGPKFAALIQEGKFSWEEFSKALAEGDTIKKAARDTNDLGEQWTILKNNVLVALEPIATRVFTGLGKAMQWVVDHRKEFQQFFTDLGIVIERVWALVGPIFKAFGESLLLAFLLIDDLIHGRWAKMWDDFVAILRNMVDLALAPIRGLYALFQGAFDDIGRGLDTLVQWFVDLPGRILGAIGDFGSLLYDKGRDLMRGLIDGIVSMAGRIARAVKDAIPDVTPWGGLTPDLGFNLASGGYVPGAKGAAVLGIAHGGEYVVSNAMQASGGSWGGGGGGPSTVIVNVALTPGGPAVTRLVLSELNRAGGPKISQRAIA